MEKNLSLAVHTLSIENLDELAELYQSIFRRHPWNEEWAPGEVRHCYGDISKTMAHIPLAKFQGDFRADPLHGKTPGRL